MDALRSVRLDLFNNGVNVKVFDSNGDGEVGYKMYQVVYDSGGDLTYEQVSLPAVRSQYLSVLSVQFSSVQFSFLTDWVFGRT